MGYSEDTVRVNWGTVRVQSGYSGIRTMVVSHYMPNKASHYCKSFFN